MATKKKSPVETIVDTMPKKPVAPEPISKPEQPKQTIDLRGDKGFEEYSTKVDEQSKLPIYYNDSNGKRTGVRFPDGRDFRNLTYQQINSLVGDWNKRPLSEQEQWQASIDKNKRYNEFLQSTPEYQALVEEQKGLGEVETAPPDELTASIEQNISQKMLSESKSGLFSTPQASDFIDPNTGEPFDMKWFEATKLNKLVKNIPNSKTKTWVLNMASENPDWQKYLDGYSNEKNLNAISENMKRSDLSIKTSKEIADNPDSIEMSSKFFDEAISQKRRDLANLKRITDSDQREYAQNGGKEKLTELEQYFREQYIKDKQELETRQRQALINKLKGGMQYG